MTISAYFQYREQDSTRYWNLTNANIRLKGILDGTGVVSSVAGQLQIEVAPFTVQTFDGMTVVSDATETLTVTDDETYYVVLYVKYQLFGPPTIALQAMTAATYAAHPEKDYLITFIRLVIPPGATQVLASYYDGSVRDGLTPLQRAEWRNSVADYASLPTDEQEVQDGDIRVTLDTHTAWIYNSGTTSWDALSVTTTLENIGGRQTEYFATWNRSSNGDGIVGGNDRYGTYPTLLTTDPQLSIHPHPNLEDTIGIGMIHASVNGHRVDSYHIDYEMTTAKPGVGTRYDLVWLEVWREETLSPETEQHETYGGGLANFSVVREKYEDLDINSNESAGAAYNLNQITSTDDNKFVITKWRVWDMPSVDSANVNDPHYQVDSGGIKPQNIDGNNFERLVYGIPRGNVWRAASTTAYDNYSWAIPLLVIRRTDQENYLTNQAIQLIRSDGLRYVWEIYPTTDVDLGARTTSISQLNELTLRKNETKAFSASGFINYLDLELGTDIVTLPQDSVIHVDGFTYTLTGDLTITLPNAPTLATRHDFIYLEVTRAANPDQRDPTETSALAFVHYDLSRGFVPYYFQFNLVVSDVGTDTTVSDAMTSAGFSYVSSGLYKMATTTDERTPVDDTVWAIPVALVHRLNQTAWNRSTNPNGGTGTRPDGRDWHDIEIDDVLDMRHKLVLPGEDLKGLLEDSQQRALEGRLRTRMVEHPTWANVAGTGLLEQTSLSVAGVAGANKLPADPDNLRYIWSDASERVVFGESFPSDAAYAGTYVTWSGPSNPATLTISAPPGAYIVVDDTDAPLFSIQNYAASPVNLDGPCITDTSNGDNFDIHSPAISWGSPTATDGNGEGISYSLTTNWTNTSGINPATLGNELHVYYWICYDRSLVDDGQGNVYNDLNQGFQHIPDEVTSIENQVGPNDPAIGPLARTMVYQNYSGASLTITDADIAAAYPEFSGTISIYGVLKTFSSVQGEMAPNRIGGPNCNIDLSDTFDSIKITPSVAFSNENLSILVIFDDSDTDGWFDFRQHTKSIAGPFNWETFTWTPGSGEGSTFFEASSGKYVVSIDEVVKEQIRFGGISDYDWGLPGDELPQILVYFKQTAAPPGTDWSFWSTWNGSAAYPPARVGGMDSHVFTFMFESSPVPALTLDFLFVVSTVSPAGAGDSYLFTTKYTPYQGKNPALPAELEDDLHGTCIASGDPTATTRGSNDPRIQIFEPDSGRIDRNEVVSLEPLRSLLPHTTNDTYCLIQPWRLDYKSQRHKVGNVMERLPNLDVTAALQPFFLGEFGSNSDFKYEVLASTTTITLTRKSLEKTDLTTAAMLPSSGPFFGLLPPLSQAVLQNYSMSATGLLKSGSTIKWPDGINPTTQASLRSAGYLQGERGWSIAYENASSYILVNTASFLPGGNPVSWNKVLDVIGVAYEESPEFFCMGLAFERPSTATYLMYHSSFISPIQDPGVLRMQITVSPGPTIPADIIWNTVGGTFDAFMPHRNLILSWNAG